MSTSLEQWRVDEILRTLQDYGYYVVFEETFHHHGKERFGCTIRHCASDVVGATRFDALLAAYKRVGLGVYKK